MQLWQWIADALASGTPVALLIVLDTAGSAPGKSGAKMAVSEKGTIGTIGGGTVEKELIQAAREAMAKGETAPQVFTKVLCEAGGRDAGMMCGGEQTILAHLCQPQDRPLFVRMVEYCRLRKPMHFLVSRHGLRLAADAQIFSDSPKSASDKENEGWLYREVVGLRRRVYIIGGGHVSLALSKVLDLLEFDSVVIDERDDLETMKANDSAWKKRVAPYAEIDRVVPEGPDVFVVVMTHSHQTDLAVLLKLADKNIPYLGCMGSRNKTAAIKAALSRQFTPQQLQKFRAPVGLPINSHSPAEIAVSIAAELIQVINSGQ